MIPLDLQNNIDAHAFKSFEMQNNLLLEELQGCKKQMEKLEVEVKYLRNFHQNKSDYEDSRAIHVAAQGIILNSTIGDHCTTIAASLIHRRD